ncbi:hypothetical protein QBC36DRAFT_359953 [Triangularia setosa]|uniref:Uncharacterized protein n=1 Tax=Triangularia setosa TaxID=2587417 RepID=A0AAN6W384_9PEZI|nr:hypothetical protein QBC36DRAFT_359953 [Podospora setosa]
MPYITNYEESQHRDSPSGNAIQKDQPLEGPPARQESRLQFIMLEQEMKRLMVSRQRPGFGTHSTPRISDDRGISHQDILSGDSYEEESAPTGNDEDGRASLAGLTTGLLTRRLQARWGEVMALQERALEEWKRHFGADSPEAISPTENLAGIYDKLGHWDYAKSLQSQIGEMLEKRPQFKDTRVRAEYAEKLGTARKYQRWLIEEGEAESAERVLAKIRQNKKEENSAE